MYTYLSQKTCDIQRMTYVGNKSSYATVASSVPCYVRPLDEKESTDNDVQYGQGHFFMFEDSIDVQEGDKLIYDGAIHGVEGVARHNRGITLPHFKQALTKRERNNG